jgi:hypothetical protein
VFDIGVRGGPIVGQLCERFLQIEMPEQNFLSLLGRPVRVSTSSNRCSRDANPFLSSFIYLRLRTPLLD